MKRSLKQKIAMCLLAASLFNKSSRSSAMQRVDMSNSNANDQLSKIGLFGAIATGWVCVSIPLAIYYTFYYDPIEKFEQKNRIKLQNLLNEQAKIYKVKDVKKYWDAINKITQEDWDDIFNKAMNKRLGKNPKNIKFSNIEHHNNYDFKIYVNGIDDFIDDKTKMPPINYNEGAVKDRLFFKEYILCQEQNWSTYEYVGSSFRNLKKIINGELPVDSLKIMASPFAITFNFKYLNKFELNVCIYRLNWLSIKNNNEGYTDFIKFEQKYDVNEKFESLILEFTDAKKDFGLDF